MLTHHGCLGVPQSRSGTTSARTSSGTALADLLIFPVTVSLARPLGDRAVLDQKGDLVTDLGSYQTPLPSPRGP